MGGATVALRSGAASESMLTGHTSFGISAAGQVWDTQSWGSSSLGFQATAGGAGEDTAQALLVDFRGQLAAGGGDSLVLRSFTVLRYPAQSNP